MDIADFDYDLPPAAIAQEPVEPRDASRLLVLDRPTGALQHRTFADLPDFLRPGDLLVRNRSRVFPARLLGRRPGGGRAEVLLVKAVAPGAWEGFVRPGGKLPPGSRLRIEANLEALIGDEIATSAGAAPLRQIRLVSLEGQDADALVEQYGHVPLPPYIRRPDRPGDRSRYQTVYAREPGSVAAPTAGLHFTPALLERLEANGIQLADVVLHVGPGTFQPLKVQTTDSISLPSESFLLPAETEAAVRQTRARGGRVVAVGTTTTRVLETAAAETKSPPTGWRETTLAIVPGYRFQAIDGLVTNFHLPRSSLLLLVCALAGHDQVLGAYREALASGYRFYSYGDAMLVL